jgi:hypothetical protein
MWQRPTSLLLAAQQSRHLRLIARKGVKIWILPSLVPHVIGFSSYRWEVDLRLKISSPKSNPLILGSVAWTMSITVCLRAVCRNTPYNLIPG